MIRLILGSKKKYEFFSKIKILKSLFIFDITKLSEINDTFFFNYIMSSFSNANKTAKTTREGRFDDLNDSLLDLFPDKSIKLDIHDVAVSSGVTTCDLYNWLETNVYNFNLYASDMYSVIEYYGSRIKYFYDADGTLTHIYIYNCLLTPKISKNFFLSKFLFQIVKKYSNSDIPRKKIFLFDQKFQNLVLENKAHFFEFNLFGDNELNLSFDFIRVMNILIVIYFKEEMIKTALQKLIASTKEGGIILIGRTLEDGKNNATFYQKNDNHIVSIKKINDGYEYDHIINDLRDQ